MDVPFAAAEAPHFPPLGWQLPAARTAVMAVAGMGHYLQVPAGCTLDLAAQLHLYSHLRLACSCDNSAQLKLCMHTCHQYYTGQLTAQIRSSTEASQQHAAMATITRTTHQQLHCTTAEPGGAGAVRAPAAGRDRWRLAHGHRRRAVRAHAAGRRAAAVGGRRLAAGAVGRRAAGCSSGSGLRRRPASCRCALSELRLCCSNLHRQQARVQGTLPVLGAVLGCRLYCTAGCLCSCPHCSMFNCGPTQPGGRDCKGSLAECRVQCA